MLDEIYNQRIEFLDEIIKNSLKSIENKLYKINQEENKEIINKLEENYNMKLSTICKKIYIQGLKDGINLINECKL